MVELLQPLASLAQAETTWALMVASSLDPLHDQHHCGAHQACGPQAQAEHTSSLLRCRHGSSQLTASRQPELQDHILAGLQVPAQVVLAAQCVRQSSLESAYRDLLDRHVPSIQRRTG